MLRIHKLTSEPFNIRSKYTPLNPDVHAAQSTAIKPTSRLRFSSSSPPPDDFAFLPSLLPDTCTTATPHVNTTNDAHFVFENRRPSMVALNIAVVNIFNWYNI
jgi:hypothetical protein